MSNLFGKKICLRCSTGKYFLKSSSLEKFFNLQAKMYWRGSKHLFRSAKSLFFILISNFVSAIFFNGKKIKFQRNNGNSPNLKKKNPTTTIKPLLSHLKIKTVLVLFCSRSAGNKLIKHSLKFNDSLHFLYLGLPCRVEENILAIVCPEGIDANIIL